MAGTTDGHSSTQIWAIWLYEKISGITDEVAKYSSDQSFFFRGFRGND